MARAGAQKAVSEAAITYLTMLPVRRPDQADRRITVVHDDAFVPSPEAAALLRQS